MKTTYKKYNMNTVQYDMNAAAALENYVKDYLIFIDTCAFMHSNYELFMAKVSPLLKKYNKSIIVPQAVLGELRNMKQELRSRASRVQEHINHYVKAGLVRVFGDKNDSHVADAVFLSSFDKFRLKYNLLLITNDTDLSVDIESLGRCRSVRNIKRVQARSLTAKGFLRPVKRGAHASCSSTGGKDAKSSGNVSSRNAPFAVCQKVMAGGEVRNTVTVPVSSGSQLRALGADNQSRPVKLGEHIAAGAEGDVYETDCGSVAKVYMAQANTKMVQHKLTRMLNQRVACPGVCFPKAILYNEKNEFVGYLMPRAKGYPLHPLLNNRLFLQQHFPDWTKKDMVRLCLTLLKKISYLHTQNIILGDINLHNILVSSPDEVWLVDTDSYQIEDCPCPVGSDHFTAPEIMERKFSEFLRSMGNERFAVATLLFMIMMMGKSPYAKQQCNTILDNIRKGDFPYAVGEKSGRQTPGGDWRYMWSHLSRPIKEAFYNTFHRSGSNYAENNRLSDKMWISLFNSYLHGLENGMLDRDSMSGELFPTRHKRTDVVEQQICSKCGTRVPVHECRGGLCHSCCLTAVGNAYSNNTKILQPPHTPQSAEQPIKKILREAKSFFSDLFA